MEAIPQYEHKYNSWHCQEYKYDEGKITTRINVGAAPEREDIGMHCVQSFLQVNPCDISPTGYLIE